MAADVKIVSFIGSDPHRLFESCPRQKTFLSLMGTTLKQPISSFLAVPVFPLA